MEFSCDRSELERLEKDMETLKDAVMTRESDWNRAMEREECYREQLKRFAAEMETARHLSDSRHGELERLAQTLAVIGDIFIDFQVNFRIVFQLILVLNLGFNLVKYL